MGSLKQVEHVTVDKAARGSTLALLPVFIVACLLSVMLVAAFFSPPPTFAAGDGDLADVHASGTPTIEAPLALDAANDPKSLTGVPPTVGTGTATPVGVGGAPVANWPEHALRDFAETVDWPPIVRVETGDRVSVRKSVSGTDWQLASIRSFDFKAASEAGFTAEKEDARLSGYIVTLEPFYTMPAYMAVLRDSEGQPVERRFRWQVQSWVLGIDAHGPGTANVDLRALARQLLAVAIQNGLVVPTTFQPSPTATQTPEASPSCTVQFSDVPSDMWAARYIQDLACRGVVSGYSDGTFRPQSPTTRAQLVKMVVLIAGLPLLNPDTPSFSDVGPSHIFYRYVETAHAHNLINGYNDDTFRPDASVSRAQVAKIVVLSKGWNLQVPARPATLCDVSAGHWAYSYVQVAIAHGIFTGYGDGCFHPDDNATRAQLAKVLVLAGR